MEIQEITTLPIFCTNSKGCYFRYKNGKEVFLPFSETHGNIRPGDKVLLAIFHNQVNDEYTASEKIIKYLSDTIMPIDDQYINPENKISLLNHYKLNQEINGIIYSFSPLGANIALDMKYTGILYNDKIFHSYNIGDSIKVYIKKIREDGKIDLALQPQGYRNYINSNTETILTALQKEGGFIAVNDDSSPITIQEKFQMSKRKFKIAVGALLKSKKISADQSGIRIV